MKAEFIPYHLNKIYSFEEGWEPAVIGFDPEGNTIEDSYFPVDIYLSPKENWERFRSEVNGISGKQSFLASVREIIKRVAEWNKWR